jgi:pimeloyl-ACP methyl ester carboxylesterase
VWRGVTTKLAPTFRCIAPTLPLGAHRQPMRPGADLSIDGIALLVAEFLERLDLHDVTLIMNDWGGPQLLVDHNRTERISRLVLVACEAFDNLRRRPTMNPTLVQEPGLREVPRRAGWLASVS